MKYSVLATIVSAMLTFSVTTVQSQNGPNKAVRIVVPFSAGGSTDTVARIMADKLSPALKQPVIIENRPGAGGAIGSDVVAKSPADGATLLVGTSSTLAIAPHLYSNLPYSPARDFAPISLLGTSDVLLVVTPKVPARTLRELIAYAKANPGKLTFASSGNGSISHLLGEHFKALAGVDIVHVPYRGDSQMVTDMLGGQVDMAFGTSVAWLPHLRAGSVIALAITSPKRSTTLTDLPTMAEAGLPGYEAVQWFGIVAPAGTPKDLVERLNAEMRAILAKSETQTKFRELGFDIVGDQSSEFSAFLKDEIAKWQKIVTSSGAKVN